MSTSKKQNYSKVMRSAQDDEMDFKWTSIKNILKESKLTIIDKITKWREKNDMGVVEFCKMFGISTSQYYKLMDLEKNVSILTLAEICQTLQIEIQMSLKPIKNRERKHKT